MTPTPESEEKVRSSFARQGLMQTFTAELLLVESGRVHIAAPISDTVSLQHGAAHAGVTFALGDSAAGYSALTTLGCDAEVMTVEMKINLLRPAIGDRLVAEGRIIKPGRRLIVVQADVFAETAEQRSQVALLQGTMIPV